MVMRVGSIWIVLLAAAAVSFGAGDVQAAGECKAQSPGVPGPSYVYFAVGSAKLGPQAKATIDEAAAWVKTQNTKGWVMAVIGYADTTGSSQRNIDLSERRANAVIYYIVSKYKMPLNRLVQPFGYGQLEPVAENKTKAGRAKNRRVEIRLMVNKGISGQVGNSGQ